MKFFAAGLLILFNSTFCAGQAAKTADRVAAITYPEFSSEGIVKVVTKRQAAEIIKNKVHITGIRYLVVLNDTVKVLPRRGEDYSSFVLPVFEKENWEWIDWGSGNFPGGPRFTSIQLHKGNTYCVVFRKYTFTIRKTGDYYNTRLTEEFEFIEKERK